MLEVRCLTKTNKMSTVQSDQTFTRNELFFFFYQADVLVGTAAQNLKLDQNPCAEALRKGAGEGSDNESVHQKVQ